MHNRVLKIGDFGLAAKLDYHSEKKKTICGTPNYLAPEFLEGNNEHGFKADVWSLGVLTYTISIGKAPFATSEVKKKYCLHIDVNYHSKKEIASVSLGIYLKISIIESIKYFIFFYYLLIFTCELCSKYK